MNFLRSFIKILTVSPRRYMGQADRADIRENVNPYVGEPEVRDDPEAPGYVDRYRLSEDEREDIEEDYR